MKKNATRITGIHFSEAIYKAVVRAAKVRDYASPSACMRAAVEKEEVESVRASLCRHRGIHESHIARELLMEQLSRVRSRIRGFSGSVRSTRISPPLVLASSDFLI